MQYKIPAPWQSTETGRTVASLSTVDQVVDHVGRQLTYSQARMLAEANGADLVGPDAEQTLAWVSGVHVTTASVLRLIRNAH